jgi:hypothetical protein
VLWIVLGLIILVAGIAAFGRGSRALGTALMLGVVVLVGVLVLYG